MMSGHSCMHAFLSLAFVGSMGTGFVSVSPSAGDCKPESSSTSLYISLYVILNTSTSFHFPSMSFSIALYVVSYFPLCHFKFPSM